jgi:hypothetical protein
LPTPFQNIYDKFLNSITDRNLVVNMTDDDLASTLDIYLSEASDLWFKNCLKDLSDRNTTQFNQTLTSEEEWIIIKGMVLSWISHIINDENKLKAKITTKDYNAFSGANMLKELLNLQKQTQQELKRLVVSYSYNGFEGFK